MAEPSELSEREKSDDEGALERAVVRRDRLRDRMAWWETHKGSLLGVWMLAGGGAGFAIGRSLRVAFSLPDLAQWLGLVLGVALAGRAVTARYDPRQLEAAQRSVRALEEGVRRSGSQGEKKKPALKKK